MLSLSLGLLGGLLLPRCGSRPTRPIVIMSSEPPLPSGNIDEQLDRAERIVADHETGTLFVVSPDHPRVVAIATEPQGWF